MTGFVANIEERTVQNTNFRQVLFTGPHSQLVVMALQPGEDIGSEVHANVDQFFRFESGQGKIVINHEETAVSDGWAAIVPAGILHNVLNTGTEPLKLYTLYSPANHPEETVHLTKADAVAIEKAQE